MSAFMANLIYNTPHLAEYFINHRRCWDEFYPSERWIFERVAHEQDGFGRVLDVGCAVGGLGCALTEKFLVSSYLGIDINAQAIDYARQTCELSVPTAFVCGDIVSATDIENESFDTVASLSVADWNVDTAEIVGACWDKVAPGGSLIISLRLTDCSSTRDFRESYQYIVPGGDFEMPDDKTALEKAPYVVLNGREALRMFLDLKCRPQTILAYGDWGIPSATAVTPYDRVAFTVLAVTRARNDTKNNEEPRFECHLPADVLI
jgi:SAM-dependent methyltransferase